ncbi:hypothetical protein [Erythrobacter sp. Alg231-14]|uniref:hypothetical protein n=1 Tax=Erythrobacter sp. Alg231-14 TaxID=1922225 RepID=UPI00307B1539
MQSLPKMGSPRMAAAALLAGLSLILSGCFITPGKFTSELILTEEDRFTFTYEGEIFFLGLSSLAEMGAAADEFVADDCYDEDTYEDRECTAAELSDQRAAWDANAGMRAAEAAQEAQQMSAMMGGIDPTDPEAAAELVDLLMRQKGWDRVEDKGDGLFDVSYSVSGELSHDFMFPVIEGFPMMNPFVQIHLRDANMVRINAPGFAAQNDASPMGGMMGGMAGMAGLAAMGAEQGNSEMPEVAVMEGTFTIVTSGIIRANNTDEGGVPTARGDELVWTISPRTQAAPTALIDMTR